MDLNVQRVTHIKKCYPFPKICALSTAKGMNVDMKKAVVIGAGQTGRGYVTRYLTEKNYDIVFIDINHKLVEKMDKDKEFSIHFYNRDRTPVHVSDYKVYDVYTKEAEEAIHESDYIFTAVGEQNLKDVAKQIKEGFENKQKNTVIITCENGINPARVLRNSLQDLGCLKGYVISQTAVFCSTVNLLQTRLDILSQNETYFPYDCDEFTGDFDFSGAVKVHNFEKFLKRKIYTYNCLAGLISYCGYIKGYKVYGEAANDMEISELMDRLLKELNPALAKYFEIDIKDQEDFANRALTKFKDKNILDYTIKNGRDAKRKLGPTERIIAPMQIIANNGGDVRILEFNAAAALCYWEEQKDNGREAKYLTTPFDEFYKIAGIDADSEITHSVDKYLEEIKKSRASISLIEIIYD